MYFRGVRIRFFKSQETSNGILPSQDKVYIVKHCCSGAVLQKFNNNTWEPLKFFSKKCTPTELKYSVFDIELLAMYLAMK